MQEKRYTDTLLACVQSFEEYDAAQMFSVYKSEFKAIYEMQKESKAPEALENFFTTNATPSLSPMATKLFNILPSLIA